jgi:hypothetical protein
MLNQTILSIVYIVLIILLIILNSLEILKNYTALYDVQKRFLFASSTLFIILFFFLRSFIITNEDNTYIILLAILYTLWFYLTKLITNYVSGNNYSFNNLI